MFVDQLKSVYFLLLGLFHCRHRVRVARAILQRRDHDDSGLVEGLGALAAAGKEGVKDDKTAVRAAGARVKRRMVANVAVRRRPASDGDVSASGKIRVLIGVKRKPRRVRRAVAGLNRRNRELREFVR